MVNKVIPTTLVCDIPNLFKEHLELNIMSRLSRKKLEKGLWILSPTQWIFEKQNKKVQLSNIKARSPI